MSVAHLICKKHWPLSSVKDIENLLIQHGIDFNHKYDAGPQPNKLIQAMSNAQRKRDIKLLDDKKFSTSIDENTLKHQSVASICYRCA